MASSIVVSDLLKKLDQQLTCPVCLDRYTQPRTLPCLHSFCHDCLDSFPVKDNGTNRFLACPACRQKVRLSKKGTNGLRSAFHINNLLDLRRVLEKASVSQESSAMECSSHNKPLEVYCNTCDELVCYPCALKLHQSHECDSIADAFPKHQQQIEHNLGFVKKKLSAVNKSVHSLEKQRKGFLEQIQSARKDIKATVQDLMQLLQESEKELMKELDQVTDAYVAEVTAREDEASSLISQLNTCENFVKEELRIGNPQEILGMKSQMMECMATVFSQVNPQPLEETRVKFVKSAGVMEACHNLGSVVRCDRFKTIKNKTTFDLCGAASDSPISSKLVFCKISPVKFNDPSVVFDCSVQQVSPVTFEINHCSPIAGLHQLMVQVGGADILATPHTVKVVPCTQSRYFITDLPLSAVGVTREGHQLIVADCSQHCVSVFDVTSGRKIRSFGQRGSERQQFLYPRGVAVGKDGSIFVADSTNHRIQVLTEEGAFVATVGTKGSQQLQFYQLWDIAIHHNGKVFVTDAGNNRVHVLNPDLSFSHCFGSTGARPGEFNDPRGLAIDTDGMVYVADFNNRRVQKFTPEGELSTIINTKGEGGGRLNRPHGLCVDGNDILYVTERDNDTVSVFTSAGKFLGYVGASDGSSFKCPYFITSDLTGRLYIGDKNGVRVVTY